MTNSNNTPRRMPQNIAEKLQSPAFRKSYEEGVFTMERKVMCATGQPSYRIKADNSAIWCVVCEQISEDAGHVQHLFCPYCVVFHHPVAEVAGTKATSALAHSSSR